MLAALNRYIENGIRPGGFLNAVLCNDLKEAIGRADYINMPLIPSYVNWLYNEAPSACWGSSQKVDSWIAAKQTEWFNQSDTPTVPSKDGLSDG